jgi:hypothetical protein
MVGGKFAWVSVVDFRLTAVHRQPRIRYAVSCLVFTFRIDFSADIAGANAAGWSSVLVRTGVYDPVDGPPTHNPTHEAENVEAAVQWAIDREVKRSV